MALSGLRKGIEEITKSAAGGGGGKFTPFIGWKDGDVKTLYFLTAAQDIPKLKLHNFVEIPAEDKDGNEYTRYGTYVCRKDPVFREESGNTCDLCDRIGHVAVEKFVALAVELETIKNGKKITGVEPVMRKFEDREGNEREVPQIGLVVQASRNFFAPYVAWESRKDLEETSFEVQREGASTDTKYYFFPVDEKPDLSEYEVPNLEDLIEGMGSEERYEEVAEVQPGSQKSWGKPSGGKKSASSSKAQTAQTQGSDLNSQFEAIRNEVKGKRASEAEELETYDE
jgi:hypothetical protein